MKQAYDPYLERYLKEYQDNPRSRIFAPLAEAYRKSGLVDEAIEICKEGLQYHPNFISGMVALARAYLDKGLYTATIRELEKVVSEVPDNYLAQKLLAQSYLLVGDIDSALKSYKMVVYLNPKDEESKSALAKIESKQSEITGDIPEDSDLALAEDLPLITPKPKLYEDDDENMELDQESSLIIKELISEEPQMDFEVKKMSQAFEDQNIQEESEPDKILTNISTLTMGELLASQGHKEKALEVYKKILQENPEQLLIKQKIEELEDELGVRSYKGEPEKEIDKEPDSYEQQLTRMDSSPKESKEDYDLSDIDLIKDKYDPEPSILDNAFEDEKIRTEIDLDEELDDDWIFKSPSENIKLLKLRSLLNKIRLYRISSRKSS